LLGAARKRPPAEAGNETDAGYRAYALARTAIVSGRKANADPALGEFEKTYAADWAYEIAELHALRGDTDQAFAWLNRTHGQHDPALIGVLSVNVDPDMKSLHKEPRWSVFLHKMNLPE
jgi:hypothetical protein